MELLVVLLILLSSGLDAIRDAKYGKIDWHKWHLLKWVAWYPALAFIMVVHLPWWAWVPTIAGAWGVWRLSVTTFGGRTWESYWWKQLKRKVGL